jgi:hypothetical protein
MGTIASALRPFAGHLDGTPRVYVDANVPVGAIALMRQRLGWDVFYVVEHDDCRRLPDREHFSRALDQGRTLITLDRDFLDDRAFPPSLSPGVIVCSAADEGVLARLLTHIDQSIFRVHAADDRPLRGRKVWITVDDLARPVALV